MPYIKQEKREEFIIKSSQLPTNMSIDLLSLAGQNCNCAGDLNYAFTKIIHSYIKQNGENYQNYNDAIGALESCKLELYRREVAPYEDVKIEVNGDV